MEVVKEYSDKLWHSIVDLLPKLTLAVVVLVIGFWVVNIISKITNRAFNKRNFDYSLQSFLRSIISVGLKILVIITVAGILGIQTTSFVAVIGAIGLAVGLALQGSLANFAGGVLILTFKPYKIDDLIEVQGQTGFVKEIHVFNTILVTPENKTVILPNGVVSNGIIINYTKHGNLRVDITMAIAADGDVKKARDVVMQVLNADPKILKDPPPSVNVQKVGDGMITLAIRPYTSPDHYWDVFFQTQESIKSSFGKSGISDPVPHRVIINKS